jgi:GTPase
MTEATKGPIPGFKSGFVAILGVPNVGKSTLVNRLTGRKVAGVSSRPQTTRRRILGVRTEPLLQAVFMDTPGYAPPQGLLGEHMNNMALGAAREADLIMMVVEAMHPETADGLLPLVRDKKAPIVLVINKIDLIPKPTLLPTLERVGASGSGFAEIVPISALQDDGIDILLGLVRKYLPEGPPWFGPEQAEVRKEDIGPLVQEVIQEKLFSHMHQEVPYGSAVLIESTEDDGGMIRVEGVILVDKDGHKGMVIGEGGHMIKTIGSEARHDLETMLSRKVFLGLRVKVDKGWRDKESKLAELGYLPPRVEN